MGRTLTYYLAENPWYLVAALGAVAAGFLVALRVTQDGRHLARALVALGLAGAVLVVEQLWVTDAERVEWAVRDLARAFARSDADAVLALLDDHVTFGIRNTTFGEELELSTIPLFLRGVKFDFIRVTRLETSVGGQTQRGQAEFRAMAAGSLDPGLGGRNFAGNSAWSLGFRKAQSGAWKVTRITAVELPQYTVLPSSLRVLPRPPAVPPVGAAAPSVGAAGPSLEPASPSLRRGFGRGRQGP